MMIKIGTHGHYDIQFGKSYKKWLLEKKEVTRDKSHSEIKG